MVLQKGFGEEETEANTQEKIEAYCDQFGKINAVRMRRGDIEGKGAAGKGKGQFKVSCYAFLTCCTCCSLCRIFSRDPSSLSSPTRLMPKSLPSKKAFPNSPLTVLK